MIEEGLFNFLNTNLVGQAGLAAGAVYMGTVPESATMPCVMFETVTSKSDTTMDGPSGYVVRRFQFNFYGADKALGAPGSGLVAAKKVQEALRLMFDGLTGTLPDGTKLFNVIRDSEVDSYDADTNIYHLLTDYFIHFQQPGAGD